ncbi:hypothetical protein HZA55_00035, partial [Candidatus Poribacteria bacterium]|nr:hypothetical protein [Candidatus Poribacteria bacterium]
VKIRLSYMALSFKRLAKCSVSLNIREKIPAFTAGINMGDAISYGHPLPGELEQGRHDELIVSMGALPDLSEYEFSYNISVEPRKFSKIKALENIGGIKISSSLFSKKFNAWIFSDNKDLWIVKDDKTEKLENFSIYIFEYLENDSAKPLLFIKGEAQNKNKYPLIEKLCSSYQTEKKENFITITLKEADILDVLKEINHSGLKITVDSWYINPVLLVTE